MKQQKNIEQELLKGLRGESPKWTVNEAWQEVYRGHRDKFAWQSFKAGLDFEASKDIFQEMVLVLYEVISKQQLELEALNHDAPISAYLYGIFRNLLKNWYQQKKVKATESLDLQKIILRDLGDFGTVVPLYGETDAIQRALDAFFIWDQKMSTGKRGLCRDVLSLEVHEDLDESLGSSWALSAFPGKKMDDWKSNCKYKFMRFLFEQKQWKVLMQAIRQESGASLHCLKTQEILMKKYFKEILIYCHRRRAGISYPEFEAEMLGNTDLQEIVEYIFRWKKKGTDWGPAFDQKTKDFVLGLMDEPPSEATLQALQINESSADGLAVLPETLTDLHLISLSLDEYFLQYLHLATNFEVRLPVLATVVYDPQEGPWLMQELGLDKLEMEMFG